MIDKIYFRIKDIQEESPLKGEGCVRLAIKDLGIKPYYGRKFNKEQKELIIDKIKRR